MTDAGEKLVIPEHVAATTDGGGRWTKKRDVPRAMGHKTGYGMLKKTVRVTSDMGIQYFTVYGFFTENWECLAEEVGTLMQLMRYYLVRSLKITSQNSAKVGMLGEKSRFDKNIIKEVGNLVEGTKDSTGTRFIVAVNYGSWDEIMRAARKPVKEYRDNRRGVNEIGEAVSNSHLDTHDLSGPDLLMRINGEMRLSDYLLWQLAHTELYMTDCLWPDFDKEELEKATVAYNGREYGFGDGR